MTSRRTLLAGIGGVAATAALPLSLGAKAKAKTGKLPHRIELGDTIGIVAPASAASARQVETAAYHVSGMGLVPRMGRHVSDTDGYLAGTDADRAADLNAMFADDDVRAIFAVRGGWGMARILPLLDWDMIRAKPKLMIGYSDITAFHLALAQQAGYPSIHAANAASSWQKESWDSLWRLAFTGEMPVLGGIENEPKGGAGPQGRTIRGGVARGRLLGGNLTILSTLMGTPWLPDFDGAILFLEDVDEAEYRIDRMLRQLELAGLLGGLSGVVFGRCSSCANNDADYGGFTLDQLMDQYLAPLGIPAFVGANIGHIRNQLSMPSGGMVEMDADARTIRLLQPIVR